jgi:succinate-semialdehyde dehydrogenase/glutarate-semialdehyde dehydrogenase
VAAQRVIPIAAPEGVEEESYSRLMTGALKALKRIPGLR